MHSGTAPYPPRLHESTHAARRGAGAWLEWVVDRSETGKQDSVEVDVSCCNPVREEKGICCALRGCPLARQAVADLVPG